MPRLHLLSNPLSSNMGSYLLKRRKKGGRLVSDRVNLCTHLYQMLKLHQQKDQICLCEFIEKKTIPIRSKKPTLRTVFQLSPHRSPTINLGLINHESQAVLVETGCHLDMWPQLLHHCCWGHWYLKWIRRGRRQKFSEAQPKITASYCKAICWYDRHFRILKSKIRKRGLLNVCGNPWKYNTMDYDLKSSAWTKSNIWNVLENNMMNATI